MLDSLNLDSGSISPQVCCGIAKDFGLEHLVLDESLDLLGDTSTLG
jgi:hypothetical protein